MCIYRSKHTVLSCTYIQAALASQILNQFACRISSSVIVKKCSTLFLQSRQIRNNRRCHDSIYEAITRAIRDGEDVFLSQETERPPRKSSGSSESRKKDVVFCRLRLHRARMKRTIDTTDRHRAPDRFALRQCARASTYALQDDTR